MIAHRPALFLLEAELSPGFEVDPEALPPNVGYQIAQALVDCPAAMHPLVTMTDPDVDAVSITLTWWLYAESEEDAGSFARVLGAALFRRAGVWDWPGLEFRVQVERADLDRGDGGAFLRDLSAQQVYDLLRHRRG